LGVNQVGGVSLRVAMWWWGCCYVCDCLAVGLLCILVWVVLCQGGFGRRL